MTSSSLSTWPAAVILHRPTRHVLHTLPQSRVCWPPPTAISRLPGRCYAPLQTVIFRLGVLMNCHALTMHCHVVMTRTSNNQLGSIPLNGTRQWTASGYDENELARLRDLLASIHSIPVYEDGGQPMVEELQDRIETLRHDITTTAIDEYAEWHDVTLDIESSEAQQSALRATIERTEHELHEVERDFQSLMREATTAAQRHWGRFKKLIREITKRDKEIADLRAIIRDQAITRENERRAKDDVIDALRAALDIAGASTTQ
ncbi:hypothetical protein K504DRAFT_57808 [Pleomassaria siparia CBS 279.74]|uniref:Uncharacterized protein n=1 Tax=Pleomassaria siparia CBS 279.74 TaxID=1314801 RepID=A0A6G1JP45_9PLEO|nr:hypothetical protein K504DRAFT_57808 [Pleomassaria siparia CBS 279.74]